MAAERNKLWYLENKEIIKAILQNGEVFGEQVLL